MELLFVNCLTPSPEKRSSDNNGSPPPPPNPPVKSWLMVFCEQLINSAIVASIAALSVVAATGEGSTSGKAGSFAFGMTFFVELRKWRKI